MIVFRLSKGKYHQDLTGKGAELFGGRWNSKGVAMLYTSQSRALAFAEVSIHIPIGIIPKDYHLISIALPEDVVILEMASEILPKDRRSNPHSDSTQKLGDQFIADSKYLAIKVPSAVVPGDFNYLINPHHQQISKLFIASVEPFEFDSRLVPRH